MSLKKAFDRGLIAGMLLMLGAQAVYWFIGGHPDASSVRTALVVVQCVVGLGGGAWLIGLRARLSESAI